MVPSNRTIACEEILRWAQKKAIGRLPEEAWQFKSFEQIASGRSRAAVCIEEEDTDLWSTRVEDPDRDTAGRIWTTEITLITKSDSTRFTVRQLVGSAEAALEDVEPHVPGVVRQIIKAPGMSSGIFQLTDQPAIIRSENTPIS